MGYTKYNPEDDKKYKDVQTARTQHNANKPGSYQHSDNYGVAMGYKQQLEDRDPFSYNVNSDALYQQMKDNYIQQGMLASMDTMGQAAAMTGGYGNSYAQSAGQQMYNQHLTQLNNIVPELYSTAYNKYLQEGQQLQNLYEMNMGIEEQNYERWKNDIDRWYKEDTRLANEETNLYKRGNGGNGGNNYVVLSAEAQAKWRKNIGNTWSSVTKVWNDMTVANHDPIGSASFVLGEALDRGIKPTESDFDSLQTKLEKAGMTEDEAVAFLAEWAVAFGLIDKKPQYTPKSGPGGRTSDFTVSNM